MAISRRVKTVHGVGEGGWGCTGIAVWMPDPFLHEIYDVEESDWWCECESRMRHDEV